MLPLAGDLRSAAQADLRLQGTPHLLHLRMSTHASLCTPQCHLHPHRHLTLRHTNSPQSSQRCPLIPHHSVDRNKRASLLAGWASLSLVPVLFSWRVGSYDFDFWGDLACICIVFINTSLEEKSRKRLNDTDMAKCQCQPHFGCWPAGRFCHRPLHGPARIRQQRGTSGWRGS